MAKFNIPRLDGESDLDFRRRYHREWERLTRIEKGLPVRAPKGTPCSVDSCDGKVHSKGLCRKHYVARWTAKQGDEYRQKRSEFHDMYSQWAEREKRDGLCEEWKDFHAFVAGVGARPSKAHTLVRIDQTKPYGPDNFRWRERLLKVPSESQKEFNARKWQSRRVNHPTFERRRHLVRHFGITPDLYDEMLSNQGGLCAICRQPEKHKRTDTGEPKSLAVDHNHSTGVVRDLLCWRCNTALGKLEENTDIMRAMIAYVDKWSGENPAPHRPPPVKPNVHEIMLETPWGRLHASAAARKAGLSPRTVLSRIRYGWNEEDLLQPIRRHRK